jgi:sulfatase modifying factor 1
VTYRPSPVFGLGLLWAACLGCARTGLDGPFTVSTGAAGVSPSNGVSGGAAGGGDVVPPADGGTGRMTNDGAAGQGDPSAGADGGLLGVAPSCAPGGPGMSNCGAAQENCCTSLEVTGGTFFRTYMNDGSGPMGEADPATVSSFRLDKYDVTVGRFRRFVTAGRAGWLPAEGSGKHTHLNGGRGLVDVGSYSPPPIDTIYELGWVAGVNSEIWLTDEQLISRNVNGPGATADSCLGHTWTPSAGDNENLPINCVNSFEAYAFCIWDGGFLPSDAEWEYAAVGGSQQREYPWGSTPPMMNPAYAIYGCDVPDMYVGCIGAPKIAPVGTAALGAGLWGQLDLVGNLRQLVRDRWDFRLRATEQMIYVDPCVDCATVSENGTFDSVVRGSHYRDSLSRLPPTVLNNYVPTNVGEDFIGFRCARAP